MTREELWLRAVTAAVGADRRPVVPVSVAARAAAIADAVVWEADARTREGVNPKEHVFRSPALVLARSD